MGQGHWKYRIAVLGLLVISVALLPRWVLAQSVTQVTPATGGGSVDPTMGFLEWAVREGGAFAVIMVILFFYRRDWKQATEFWRDQHAITTKLVQESTAAQVQVSAALAENTRVAHGLKNVLQHLVPQRRQPEDRDGG